MTHAEFVAAYQAGRVNVSIDRDSARRFVAGRGLLAFVLLPVLGISVAIALIGHFIVGAIVFLAALGLRWLVRASAQGFVLQRALQDERFYREAVAARVLRVDEDPQPLQSA
jgi:ABC-type protease/lipase transport system fused ATPase/permease subunit